MIIMGKRIVVAQELALYSDQVERLKKFGELRIYSDLAKTPEEWVERCKGFDIICTGKFGFRQKVYELADVFISLPFVGVGWLDKARLKENNITIAYSPGCNKDAVSEWIVGMMINLFRELPKYINARDLPLRTSPGITLGLTSKKACILGAGEIGSRVGKICETFDMQVNYFRRDDNLLESIRDADVVINCLSQNPTTVGLLNGEFFSTFKKGSYFISVTSQTIYDLGALLAALGENIVAAAIDAGDAQAGDVNDYFYRKLLENGKILATPHVAFSTDVRARVANDMMIDNIEAYLSGKAINWL